MSVTIRSTNPKITDDNVAKLEKYMVENATLPEVTSSDAGQVLSVGSDGTWEATTIDGDNVIYSEGVSVNDKIDEVETDLSTYKHIEFYSTSTTFSSGVGTVTHNLGKPCKVIPLAKNGLIPFYVVDATNNAFTLYIVWVKTNSSADTQMATNYSGTIDIEYFLVY